MATGVLYRRSDEVRAHLESCDMCSRRLAEIMQQNQVLERRLTQVTLDDVEAAGMTLRAEGIVQVADAESWLTPQSYELAKQTALFSTPCRVGQYELQGLIAPGGMGEVYKAIHSRLKREVAVKVIRRNQQDSPLFYDNFLREIETVGQMEHPNMVRAYDALEFDGYLFLVMELLSGESLHTLVSKGRLLTLHEVLEVMIGACKAILHLHANGYLHLDIKPANIMLLDSGVTKLIDYGLAVRREAVSSGGVLFGTVGYMPPEQQNAGIVDQRADIFAAGKVFHFLLMKAMMSAETHREVFVQGELHSLTEKMVDDEPARRPENATELLDVLINLQEILHSESGAERLLTKNALTSVADQGHSRTFSRLSRYSVVLLLAAFVVFFIWRGIDLKSGVGNMRVAGDLTNSIGMQLNVVPEGTLRNDTTYFLGGDTWQFSSEQSISFSPFYIGVYEVTQKEYRKVMGENPSKFKKDEFPVESLTFAEAEEFCRRLSEFPEEKRAGRVYRIPTNLEWEYACRAGSSTKFSFGDEEWKIDSHAWYNGNSGAPHAVGLKRANAWGIFDMHGNVSEFCKFGENSSEQLPDEVRLNAKFGLRGGSWAKDSLRCQSGACTVSYVDRHWGSMGLRVVCNLIPDTLAEPEAGEEFETTPYSVVLDLRADPDPKPIRTANAVLYREENSTHYWTPAEINKWAEIVYRLDLPGPIESTLDFGTLVWVYNEHYFPVFDPLAQGTLEISRDGENWHVIFHSESSVPLVDNRTSVLPLLKGSKVVYLRAKLFASKFGKEVRFSQFLRRDDTREPHQFQFLLRSEPSTGDKRVDGNSTN